jgi:hypothetical protein
MHCPLGTCVCVYLFSVMSGSDPHGTCNADKDRGPNGVQRHGLELVRWNETWMSEQSWIARVQACRYKKWMLWEEEQRQGSVLKLLWMVWIPTTLVTWIWVGVPSGVLRTHSADRHGALSGVSICISKRCLCSWLLRKAGSTWEHQEHIGHFGSKVLLQGVLAGVGMLNSKKWHFTQIFRSRLISPIA